MNGKRILLVDDEPAILRFAERALIFEGADVTTATTAAEVMTRLGDQLVFDLLILDLCLPDMSGWDALDAVQRRLPDGHTMRFVVFTARADDESKVEASARGIGFIEKPVSTADFVREVRALLAP
jgi:two-component system KDP operon response regulator KdpE